MTKVLAGSVLVTLFLAAYSLTTNHYPLAPAKAQTFQGPGTSAGVGTGAISVGSSNNISVGTTTPLSNVRVLIVGSSTQAGEFAIQVRSSISGPVFLVTNDGRVSIGSTSFASGTAASGTFGPQPGAGGLFVHGPIRSSLDFRAEGLAVGTTTAQSGGNALITGNLTVQGSFGNVSAGNVSAGKFASSSGGGNFSFPASLGIATTSNVGMPQELSVYGDAYITGNLGIGVESPNNTIQVANLINFDNANSSTYIGYLAGTTSTGWGNTTFGYNALYANNGGYLNTAVGYRAGYSNTTGYQNVFFGANAGYSNLTGYDNVFTGYNSGYSNTSGFNNTFVGRDSGYSNTTGDANTYGGAYAGYSNATGTGNVAIGKNAGYSNMVSSNTFIGYSAGHSNVTGIYNVSVGNWAGFHNTSSSNTYFGYQAGASSTTGYNQTFVGYQAGNRNTTGYSNTYAGHEAAYSGTTNNENVVIGARAGYTNTAYNDNIFIGSLAMENSGTSWGDVVIGYNAAGLDCSTTISIGSKACYGDPDTGGGEWAIGYEALYEGSWSEATAVGYQANRESFDNDDFDANVGGFTFGYQSGYYNANQSESFASFGVGAAYSGTSTAGTFVGYFAGYNNFTFNTFIGSEAGYSNTFGTSTFVGQRAGYNNTTGGANTFVGSETGFSNTAGERNTFVGTTAGYSNTTGNENSFIGYRAGYNNTTGQRNVFFGTTAGYLNATGSSNVFFGKDAGYNNAVSSNTFIGYQSGYLNTTGDNNVFVGYQAGTNNTTGYDNTFAGRNTGGDNTTGTGNVFLGYWVAPNNTAGSNNTFVGGTAGNGNTTGNDNTYFGDCTACNITTANNNTFFGYQAGVSTNATATHNTYFGIYAGSIFYFGTTSYNTIVTGEGGAAAGNQAGAGPITVVGGRQTAYDAEGAHNSVIIGSSAGHSSDGGRNVFVGFHAGRFDANGDNNVSVGYSAGRNNSGPLAAGFPSGSSSTYVGYRAGASATGSANTFVGYEAGDSNKGDFNTFFGYQAGFSTSTGDSNTFVGYQAGYSNTTGASGTFVGHYAGRFNTTGVNNTFIGTNAGHKNTTASSNTYIGYGAGTNSTGANNTLVGIQAGAGNTGSNNAFLGYRAGYATSTLNNSVLIGYQAGDSITSGSNNIIIGYDADATSTTSSNFLNIGNAIYGTLNNGNIGIGITDPTSRLQVTGGGLCVGSDANCNSDNNTEGTVYSASTAMTVYDVAELYPTKDKSIMSGEIVSLDPNNGVFVERALRQAQGKQGRLLGVISTEPAVLLGGFAGNQFRDEHQVAVALSGRVPVYVSTENGNIKIGDPLTISSKPGVARKADHGEHSIGYALEEFRGSKSFLSLFSSPSSDVGQIQVFVSLQQEFGTVIALDETGNLKLSDIDNRIEVEGGLQFVGDVARPTCNVETRGTMWFVRSDAKLGSSDSMQICDEFAETYKWKTAALND